MPEKKVIHYHRHHHHHTPEELLALAKQEGYKLSEDELSAVSGGKAWSDVQCDNEHLKEH